METGIYSSYPKRTKYSRGRNYRFGKFLRRKGYRRNNPINQFSMKKTRLGRYFKTDMQLVKLTVNRPINIGASGTHYILDTTANDYVNLTFLLAQSSEFATRYTQYSYYRLSGLKVTLTRRWIDPIALGVNGTSAGFISLAGGLSAIYMNLYPNLTSQATVGNAVCYADSSFKFSPFLHGEQSHYIPFPKDFTTGTNSNGLGVWNACSQFSNLTGEIAFYDSNQIVVSDEDEMLIWDATFELYAQFCNNTGT